MSEIKLEVTLDRIRGCLLGGAVGDALGAPIEFDSIEEIRERFGAAGLTDYAPAYGRIGAVTDDTQMTLFTAEGVTRAFLCVKERGACNPPSVIANAYKRWLGTQEVISRDALVTEMDGWLSRVPELQHSRAPGSTCIDALSGPFSGSIEEPINDSKGCGGVMRAAPIGLFLPIVREVVFSEGCKSAAITHGHPTGYLPSGVLAEIIAGIVRDGNTLDGSLDGAEACLAERDPVATGETREALAAARSLARTDQRSGGSPVSVEALGEGWVAEEALAIGVYCALVARDYATGVLLAANHSGDSDSTASIAGNVLGALLGVDAIPGRWLDRLEVRATIERLCDDWREIFTQDEFYTHGDDRDAWLVRYPPY